MKIRLLSDLHRETGPFTYVDEGEDVLVLAGDIGNGIHGIEWAKTIPKPVIYIAGNHEHWTHDLDANIKSMRAAAKGSNVRFLECDEAVITIGDESVRFLGATLWTDYCGEYLRKNGEKTDRTQHDMMYLAVKSMRDFTAITYKQSKLEPATLLKIHQKSRAWLDKKLKKSFEGQTVVVTHHSPSYQSLVHAHMVYDDEIAPIIGGDRRPDDKHNRIASYASDLEALAPKSDFWLHGHVHASMMYNISKCIVAVNPRGYHRGPMKSSFWWPMSPGDEAASLAKYEASPERGDVDQFDKTLILDTESTMPAHMIAKAAERFIELEKVVEVIHLHIKYAQYKDFKIAAMSLNFVSAQISEYSRLLKETLMLMCHAHRRGGFGYINGMAHMLGIHSDKYSLDVRNTMVGWELTYDMPEHIKSVADDTRRTLTNINRTMKVVKKKINRDCIFITK